MGFRDVQVGLALGEEARQMTLFSCAQLGVQAVMISALAVGQAACRRVYGHQVSVPSPDGKHLLDITEEIQSANDPDVCWQHISLRKAGQTGPIVPGNVAVISARKIAKVEWQGPAAVSVEINRSEGGSSFEMPPSEKTVDGVAVRFRVWKK